MRPKTRHRPEDDDLEYFPSSPRKPLAMGLVKAVSTLVIFVAGVVLGVSMSAQFTRYCNTHSEVFFPKMMYSANCDKECLGIDKFIRPTHLMHGMNDEELFWRASMEPRKEEFPFVRVPKVAFMFLTRGPLPFAPIWEKFFRRHEGLYSVYVHALPDYKLNVSESSVFYRRQIPSQEVEWGTISLVDAERRLMANALLDFSNQRFVLLSESCIPLYNFPTVYKYLINSMHSFIESYDDDSPCGRGRYNQNMSPEIELEQWRKGSEWIEVNRAIAVDIVADTKYYSLFQKYCKPDCYSDEHYIPTYVYMFRGSVTANRTLTWVDWSRGGPHPARYGGGSITESFVRTLRGNGTSSCSYNNDTTSICHLFARKFAPSALEPLMNLTERVMDF